MPLELDSLKKAVTALSGVLAKSDDAAFMAGLDEIARNAIKSGVIQHFEFTYELSWKFIKRWLEMNVNPSAADGVTRRELFRQAAEHRLIVDVDQWMKHHEARNLSSHTYESSIADQVYQAAFAFTRDAVELLKALEAHND